jgi:hypothetical protein
MTYDALFCHYEQRSDEVISTPGFHDVRKTRKGPRDRADWEYRMAVHREEPNDSRCRACSGIMGQRAGGLHPP